MNLATSLSHAIDEFTGFCAVGALYYPDIDVVRAGQFTAARVTGAVYWDKERCMIAVWVGHRGGGPGTSGCLDAWLQLRDEVFNLAGFESMIVGVVPQDSLDEVTAAIRQATGMLQFANTALGCAETAYDLISTLQQLKRIASESKSLSECESEALLAHTDLMFNCMVDLLGNMTVAESANVPLAFDLTAETLDPASGDKVTIKVGWAKADETLHNYTHSFELNGSKCQAHDELAVNLMLATYPEASREHYLHTFTHLRQAARAVGKYAVGKAGEAIAKASSAGEPLLHEERHEITRKVHADVVAELNPFVREMSGEPGRGSHKY